MRITEVQCISFSIVLYLKAISRETNAMYKGNWHDLNYFYLLIFS